MLIVYSLYALISNIYASTLLTADVQSTFLSVLTVSISSKQRSDLIQKSFLFTMEVWLGCGMVLVWSITFLAFKYLQKEQSMLAETLSKSAADYSIAV